MYGGGGQQNCICAQQGDTISGPWGGETWSGGHKSHPCGGESWPEGDSTSRRVPWLALSAPGTSVFTWCGESLGVVSLGVFSLCVISLGDFSLADFSLGDISLGDVSLADFSLGDVSPTDFSLVESSSPSPPLLPKILSLASAYSSSRCLRDFSFNFGRTSEG